MGLVVKGMRFMSLSVNGIEGAVGDALQGRKGSRCVGRQKGRRAEGQKGRKQLKLLKPT